MKTELSYRKQKGNACIPAEMLWDYLDGKLTYKQQHEVEVHLLDCPLCADALEGFKISGNRTKVTQLNAMLAKDITYRSNWYLSAAAASVVLVATLGLLWWALNPQSPVTENIAQQTPEVPQQQTISATTPEAPATGSNAQAPVMNSVTSDGIVTQQSTFSNNATGNASNTATTNTPVVVEPNMTASTWTDQTLKVAKDDASGDNEGIMKEEQEVTPDASGPERGVSAGAASAPPATPAPVAPGTNKPSPAPAYRNAEVNKTAKRKQASPSAETTPKKASLAEGMQYYNSSNYAEAIKVFKDVLDDDPANQEARYYLGMSYKGSGEKMKALDELTKVGPACLYYEDAIWNRALLLIDAGRKEEAKPLLQQLIVGNGKYAQKAANKLNEL